MVKTPSEANLLEEWHARHTKKNSATPNPAPSRHTPTPLLHFAVGRPSPPRSLRCGVCVFYLLSLWGRVGVSLCSQEDPNNPHLTAEQGQGGSRYGRSGRPVASRCGARSGRSARCRPNRRRDGRGPRPRCQYILDTARICPGTIHKHCRSCRKSPIRWLFYHQRDAFLSQHYCRTRSLC